MIIALGIVISGFIIMYAKKAEKEKPQAPKPTIALLPTGELVLRALAM